LTTGPRAPPHRQRGRERRRARLPAWRPTRCDWSAHGIAEV